MPNLANIEAWLRGSIPGIILLGALGSALFALGLWIVKNALKRWLPGIWRALGKLLSKAADRQIAIELVLEKSQQPFLIVLYFAAHTVLTILSVLTGSFFLYRFNAVYTAGSLVNLHTLTLLIASFFFFGLALTSIVRIAFPYWYHFSNVTKRHRLASHRSEGTDGIT